MLNAIDLYCGAGGTTTGALMSGAAKVVLAVNHWRTAIYTHSNNYPDVRHVCARLEHVDPNDFRKMKIDLILASPECTGHSNARGGRPTNDQKRAGGKEVLGWVKALKPKWLVVENVREWKDWGPCNSKGHPLKSRKGDFFREWVAELEAAGYRVEDNLLNAADFGEATSRERLFVIARRGRGPIAWPKPTHTPDKWRAAWEIIDWTLPFPSIFSRRRDLSPNTINRINFGLTKFVEPYIVYLRGTGTVQGVRDPLSTVTGSGHHHYVAMPYGLQYHGGKDGHNRSTSLNEPLPTVDASNRHAVAMPFLTEYYGTGKAQPVSIPLHTITTKPRFGLAAPMFGDTSEREEILGAFAARSDANARLVANMRSLGVWDVGYRMLNVRELLAAQGFPHDYKLHGTIEEQTMQVGNAVCPRVAKAICEALAA